MLLYIVYFVPPQLGPHLNWVWLDAFVGAVIGLGLHGGAVLGEVFRSGIEALHSGQREAALSLGMTPAKAMAYIILPQAVRVVLPPVGNYAIGLLKDTAVIYAIAVPEIMAYARNLVTETLQSAVVYLMAGAIYLCMAIPMARFAARLERGRRAWR